MAPTKKRRIDRIKAGAADNAAAALALLLQPFGKNTYRDLVNALWERQPVYSKYDIQLRVHDHVEPDIAERPLVQRVFNAYRAAKREEVKQDPVFLPRGGWKNVTDSAFADLIEGYKNDNLERLHYFLANFGAWDTPTGIGESWFFAKQRASKRKELHFEQHTMAQLIEWWQSYESEGRDLSDLVMPRFGNHGSVLVNGHAILPFSLFSDVYARLLAKLLDRQRPVIGELGGGFGRLSYFLRRQWPASTYIDFDLPECLCCATYYLMNCFPDKKFLLFGEGELTEECLAEYDFILRPSFEILKLPDRTVDLFINENGLGMMPPDACRLFVTEICRVSDAFWHRNHETRRFSFDDGSESLLNREYPIDRQLFREVLRYCDIARLVGHDQSTVKHDMYWQYYQRKSDVSCSPELVHS